MKKITLLFLLFFTTLSFSQSHSKIEGVVTYFFNKYQGDKPDLGGKVFLIDSTLATSVDIKLISEFISTKRTQNIYGLIRTRYNNYEMLTESTKGKKKQVQEYEKYLKSKDEAKVELDDYHSKLKVLGVDTKENFSIYDSKVFKELLKFTSNKDVNEKTIDANGNYSFNVSPGTYYVLIQSKNREGMSMTEYKGQIHFTKIVIKENQSKDVSHNFELSSYIY